MFYQFYEYAPSFAGHMAPDAARLAREAGFDHYLVKPVKLEAILATMHSLGVAGSV